jgi:hypothetical protein
MFEGNERLENTPSPEQKLEEVMSRIKDRLSVGSDMDGVDVAEILPAWDLIDENIKEDLKTAFPILAQALLADKLGVKRSWGGGQG